MVAQEPERVEEGKKGGKQVKRGGNPKDLLLWGGASVSEAPPSFSYPTPRAKTPRGLEPSSAGADIYIQVRGSPSLAG